MLSKKRTTNTRTRNTTLNQGFEQDLTTKQKFYLYLYHVCPAIEILNLLWKQYILHRDRENRVYHIKNSPFKPHPCGYDSMFKSVCGYIDPDMFLDYYHIRESYLSSIKIIGHPYFICRIQKTKQEIESREHYFTALINEPQIKLRCSEKIKILHRVIDYLSQTKYKLNQDQIMRYIISIFNMYNNYRILFAYPIAIDCNGELCRFE